MKKTGIIFETNFHTLEDAQNKAEALNKEFPEYSFIGADTGNDFVIIKEDEISLTN